MNKEELKKNIYDFFSKLPTEGQEYFSSMVWVKKLEEISKKYDLAIDESEGVATETMLVLLGMADVDDFEKELIVNLRQENDETEQKIIKEIISSVIEPMGKDKVKKFFTFGVQEEDENEKQEDKNLKASTQVDISSEIVKIAKENNLNIEQMGIFSEITKSMIDGKILHTEYKNEIFEKITKDESIADKITKDVNEFILSKVYKNIKDGDDIYKEKNESEIDSDIPKPPYDKKNLLEEKEITEEDLSVKKTPSSHGEIDQGSKLDPYREQI